MTKETFDDLVRKCEQNGEPFQCLARKQDGTYQISIRSKHSADKHNAFVVEHGATPLEAIKNVMRARRPAIRDEEDPLS